MLKNETPVSFVCCLSLVSYDSKLMEKIIHSSVVRWRHHCDDVIIKKSCMYVPN